MLLTSDRASHRRGPVFLLLTFAITSACWWTLAALAQREILSYGQPIFMTLYMIGGFGPTIAAYLSVMATKTESPLAEYHQRLFRWRVGLPWYLVAVGLPILLGAVATGVTVTLASGTTGRIEIESWWRIVPLFLTMVVGGGLEELGWRGVGQPELERRMGRVAATTVIGLVWAAWHLPLFFIPGVGQYGTNFPIFAASAIGLAFILAWLYGRTESILLCVIFHAMVNAVGALGLAVPSGLLGPALADAIVKLALGVALVSLWPDLRRGPAPMIAH